MSYELPATIPCLNRTSVLYLGVSPGPRRCTSKIEIAALSLAIPYTLLRGHRRHDVPLCQFLHSFCLLALSKNSVNSVKSVKTPGVLIFSIPRQTPPPYNQDHKLFLSKQKKRKSGRKKKSPVPAVAVLGVVPADTVDPEIHRQTGRRHPWIGIGHIGCIADDNRDRRNPWRPADPARCDADGQIHLRISKQTPQGDGGPLRSHNYIGCRCRTEIIEDLQ